VTAVLEDVFCLLMQKIPTLNSNATGLQTKPTGTDSENDKLLAETVKCLELLPDICSDEGSKLYKWCYDTFNAVFPCLIAGVAIQPTILYLATCILGSSLAGEASCNAVLQFYRKLATHRLNTVPQWEKYLLSTLAKLLDMAKTGKVRDVILQFIF